MIVPYAACAAAAFTTFVFPALQVPTQDNQPSRGVTIPKRWGLYRKLDNRRLVHQHPRDSLDSARYIIT